MRYRIAACVLFAGLLPGFLATEGYWKGRIPAAWQGKQLLEPLESPEAALGRRDVESEIAPAKRREIFENLARMPLYFIENRGQLDRRVAYYVPGHRWSLYFTPGGVTYAITADQASPDSGRSGRPWQAPVAFRRAHEAEPQARRWALKLDFLGANPAARPVGVEPAPAVVSYFKGSPEQWKTALPSYAKVLYRELWPGIDLVYAGTGGQLKYTFLVQPGADPSRIRLAWRGAEAVSLNAAGQLEVSTPLGGFREEKPYVFQEVDGARVEVPAAYRLEGRNGFRFELGAYDAAKPLVLDPVVLVYAGFLGGSGREFVSGIAVDGSGQAYVAGETASPDFPAAVGPDTTYNGGFADAFVAKIKADGTGLVYAGFLGGSGSDSAFRIAVDGSGQAYVAGRTDSSDFPAAGGPDTTYNGGFDAFVAKIKADGTGLVYAGYLGGSGNDAAGGIAVDASGQAYVAGSTHSSDFPAAGGPDTTYNGSGDAFVAKIKADGTGLVYAGFLGGSGRDSANGIAVDGSGQAYVAGSTDSSDFPAAGGPDTTYNGGFFDAFVAKIKADGTGLVYSGYLGGSGIDYASGIAVDGSGQAYVAGWTDSSDFPAAGGPDTTYNGGFADAFVAKIKADGTGLVYSGFLGGSGADLPFDIAVDGIGQAYVAGWTDSSDFPAAGGPDTTYNGGFADAFVAKIKADGTGLVYAGFLGGSGIDQAYGIAVDGSGQAYVAGETHSSDFPAAGGPDTTYNGSGDAFVAKISSSLRVKVDLKPQSNPNCINPRSRGTVSVAIFGSSTFNAAAIRPSTVSFGGAPALRCNLEDAFQEGPTGFFTRDGIPDLVCHFSVEAVSWPAAGTNCGPVGLAGTLIDDTPIEGSDIACRAGETTCAAGAPIPVP